MLKNIFKKCFISILVLLVILFIGMTNSQAMSNTIIEVDGETDLAFEPGRLMKYDKETNTTTEVNMEEINSLLGNSNRSGSMFLEGSSQYNGNFIKDEPSMRLTDNRQAVGNQINSFPYNNVLNIIMDSNGKKFERFDLKPGDKIRITASPKKMYFTYEDDGTIILDGVFKLVLFTE